MQKSIFVK